MQVVTCSGQARNGKNVVGEYIAAKLGWKTASFASNVKRILGDTFGFTLEQIEELKVKPEVPPGLDIPMRQALQQVGDGFRKIRSTIWLDLAFVDESPRIHMDGRYINELRKTKEFYGINVLIWRPKYENEDPNPSESQIFELVKWFRDNYQEGPVGELPDNAVEGCDLVDWFLINNTGTLDDLYVKLDNGVLPFVREHYGLRE